jgi:DNA-binding transcriptional LysR family regulator
MDPSLVGLRVLREVAERGSFTAAAASLGYTQSAVSRQVAGLEGATGVKLFDRQPDGVRLTVAGRAVLAHAVIVLDEIAAAARELQGLPVETGAIRLGVFISAGAVLVPRALATLRRTHPAIEVRTREGTTPALVRALRARTVDLALVASTPPFRAPDTERPVLVLETLTEIELRLAVPATSRLADRDVVRIEDLDGQRWIATPSTADETLLGVWPGLGGRPRISHYARDWLSKLQLVAAGCGVTTVPATLSAVVPPGVRLLTVVGGSHELRRMVLARLPGPATDTMAALVHALHHEAAGLPATRP